MLHGPGGRTKSPPPQEKDGPELGAQFSADEGAPQPPTHKLSPPCALGGSHHCSLAAVNVVPGPSAVACEDARNRKASHRSSNRLDPSDGCRCCNEHRKQVRVIRPRQSEAEAGEQRNYSELPYFGVQSPPSLCPSAQAHGAANCVPRSCGQSVSMLASKLMPRRQSPGPGSSKAVSALGSDPCCL
jgi:hypothetical protein